MKTRIPAAGRLKARKPTQLSHEADDPLDSPLGVSATRAPRSQRLAPEARRGLLLEAAARLVLEQGHLPVGLQDLAEAAKVSKALIYKYFPEPHDLYNALLERALGELTCAGLDVADESAADAATALGEVYYRYVAAAGPLIQIILRDRFMAGKASPAALAVRDRVCRHLARALRRDYALPAREAVACLSIGMTMPEECGRLVHQGELDPENGAVLCRELILGVIDVARRRGLEARR